MVLPGLFSPAGNPPAGLWKAKAVQTAVQCRGMRGGKEQYKTWKRSAL